MRTLIGAGTSSLIIGTTADRAMAGNTTTISGTQASNITTNNGKVSDTGVPAILSDGSVPSLNTAMTPTDIRDLIEAGQGSSDLVIGTTATTAMAGNTSLLAIGTTASTAMAGDTTTITTAQSTAITANTAKVSSSWTATGNDIYNSNPGFVGIGTSGAAGAKLEVAGTGTSSVPTVQINNSSSGTFNHSLELLAQNLTQDETNALIIGQRKTTKNAGYLGYIFSSNAADANVLSFGHIGATNLMALTGDGKLGIGNVGPSQALHVTGNARVTGAFYDSNNSAGSSGQVLSSTATGTDWISASGDTVYTPSIFEISNQAITSSQSRAAEMSQTLVMTGSTGVTIASGQSTALTASQAGVYEITYTMYIKTTHSVRQTIGAYVERQASGGQPAMLAGSLFATYTRIGGTNQGGEASLTNTFYADIEANDVFRVRTGRTDVNSTPVGISIADPTWPGSSTKHVISFRKINALP